MGKYYLKTYATGREFQDTGWLIDDAECPTPSLVRAIYQQRQITFGNAAEGLYRFADWLPIHRRLEGSAAPVTYRSVGLAAELGLENLYITFSGYFPERGATMLSCSFKETEAFSVCARMTGDDDRVLVVASAGNTARAFARVCSVNNIPLLLCVPEDNIDALWSVSELNDCVKLAVVESGADYFDAIHLSNIAVKHPRFYAEGGAKNVARRDGMATTFLSAVETIGRIPDYYYQAVGSGTGAIAAWEANLRLVDDGRWGSNKARLMLSQNSPFQPMTDAWCDGERTLPEASREDAGEIIAKVLSNRRPPYAIAGGLYDALADTAGVMSAHTNDELRRAGDLFERCEGIDIHPAAAIAVASLAASASGIDRSAVVMLNITGGGEARFRRENSVCHKCPDARFAIDATEDEIIETLLNLYK